MIVQFKYAGQSGIVNGLREATVGFATNTLRETTLFHGVLGKSLLFREGLAALYDVVVSDFRYHPRDRLAFRAWLEEQDRSFLASLSLQDERVRARMRELEARLAELDRQRLTRLRPFHQARMQYFNWAYETQYELDYLFDPVITVHPDEISFEAFSRDESSYARLAAKYDLFEAIDAFECGTTNIDFSARLHGELDRMRTYRSTRFDLRPSGFEVATAGGGTHKEKKIDLPDSWVMGFLQVHSTMTLGLSRFRMSAVDLFNLTTFLRGHRARTSPRALRYELTPGARVRAVLEPWEHAIELSGVFEGPKPLTVRTWGRDRLRTLARLIPHVQHLDVYVAGLGLPSIYVADLGEATFTLALSGWTDQDWTGGGTKFDLLARRLNVAPAEMTGTYEALRRVRYGTDVALANETALGLEKTRSALSYLCQVGRAMYDLGGKVYRHRELFLEPFTYKEALAATKAGAEAKTTQEKAGVAIFDRGDVFITARRPVSTGYKLTGSAKGSDGRRVRPLLSVDHEGRILEASCSCAHFKSHGLTQGPCAHVMSLRLAHMSRLEAEDRKGGSHQDP